MCIVPAKLVEFSDVVPWELIGDMAHCGGDPCFLSIETKLPDFLGSHGINILICFTTRFRVGSSHPIFELSDTCFHMC